MVRKQRSAAAIFLLASVKAVSETFRPEADLSGVVRGLGTRGCTHSVDARKLSQPLRQSLQLGVVPATLTFLLLDLLQEHIPERPENISGQASSAKGVTQRTARLNGHEASNTV